MNVFFYYKTPMIRLDDIAAIILQKTVNYFVRASVCGCHKDNPTGYPLFLFLTAGGGKGERKGLRIGKRFAIYANFQGGLLLMRQ